MLPGQFGVGSLAINLSIKDGEHDLGSLMPDYGSPGSTRTARDAWSPQLIVRARWDTHLNVRQ